MPQSPGGGWTAASLYNHQVGMPAFFKGQGNDYFQGASTVKLTGLGHILNNAGYNSKYIIGNKEFAGNSDILSAYGIPVISEVNSIGKYQKVGNGLHDHDLFNEAKLQIKQFQKDKDKPFALFLSTINTHSPNGIYDKNMEQFISNKDNGIEFSNFLLGGSRKLYCCSTQETRNRSGIYARSQSMAARTHIRGPAHLY